jgi:putative addiction module component (TIGR02574 family)
MSAAEIIERVRALPRVEQLQIAERLWADFGDDLSAESPEILGELERRAEAFRNNPNNGVPWEQVRDEARRRFGWK